MKQKWQDPIFLQNQAEGRKNRQAKGAWHSEETKKKIAGARHSQETKDKISQGNRGKVRTPEQNQQNSERLKAYYKANGHPSKGRKLSAEAVVKKKLCVNSFKKGHIPWNKDQKGVVHQTKESNEKRSKALKGKASWSKGLTKETDERVRKKGEAAQGKTENWSAEQQLRRKNRMLGNLYAFKTGLGYEPYPKSFNQIALAIRDRDNNICQQCKASKNIRSGKERVMDVHHIDYVKENCSEYNLITLCASCNSKANANRDVWKKNLS